ncbi:hypothetical protein [Parendozoicomonas haliclonae]|uniref:Uncharacterized protein n=1 Tax=Parendozoicomonas haliclonae TaxID=1960125 RepID=A0A1X7AG76_9GAMM|nr:hypothetical protein [Parendozoicomonas haliclonae]SMA39426.1 hypothetical protein EHSB41UT_01035 [Parendozoicomonas haliclonae]
MLETKAAMGKLQDISVNSNNAIQAQLSDQHNQMTRYNAAQSEELQKVLLTELQQQLKIFHSNITEALSEVEAGALFEHVGSLVQGLKVDNLVELINSLTAGRELTIENDDFIQHLGECKVNKIEDKASGQTTEISYRDNLKISSQTFEDGIMKYRMTFDDQGKMTKGEEFDDQENLIFEYHYNSAGEIINRIEY